MKKGLGIIMAGLAMLAVLGSALPAQGFVAYQPDEQIRFAGSTWVGNDVISDGGSQTMYDGLGAGDSVLFELGVENEGAFNDTYFVSGCGSAGHLKVKYFAGASNLTGQVVSGTLESATIMPGDFQSGLFLRVKATAKADPGDKLLCPVTMFSSNDGSAYDTVRVRVKVF